MFQQLVVRIIESWCKYPIVFAFKVRLSGSCSSTRLVPLSQYAGLAEDVIHSWTIPNAKTCVDISPFSMSELNFKPQIDNDICCHFLLPTLLSLMQKCLISGSKASLGACAERLGQFESNCGKYRSKRFYFVWEQLQKILFNFGILFNLTQ